MNYTAFALYRWVHQVTNYFHILRSSPSRCHGEIKMFVFHNIMEHEYFLLVWNIRQYILFSFFNTLTILDWNSISKSYSFRFWFWRMRFHQLNLFLIILTLLALFWLLHFILLFNKINVHRRFLLKFWWWNWFECAFTLV